MKNANAIDKTRNRWPTYVENVRLDCIALCLDLKHINHLIDEAIRSENWEEITRLNQLASKKCNRIIELLESVGSKS